MVKHVEVPSTLPAILRRFPISLCTTRFALFPPGGGMAFIVNFKHNLLNVEAFSG